MQALVHHHLHAPQQHQTCKPRSIIKRHTGVQGCDRPWSGVASQAARTLVDDVMAQRLTLSMAQWHWLGPSALAWQCARLVDKESSRQMMRLAEPSLTCGPLHVPNSLLLPSRDCVKRHCTGSNSRCSRPE